MTAEAAAITGGVFALAMGLIEVVKVLARKVGGKPPNNGTCHFDGEHRGRLARLDELHAPRDADGVPIWYQPRSWGQKLDEIRAALRDLAEVGRKSHRVQEQVLEELKLQNGSRRSKP